MTVTINKKMHTEYLAIVGNVDVGKSMVAVATAKVIALQDYNDQAIIPKVILAVAETDEENKSRSSKGPLWTYYSSGKCYKLLLDAHWNFQQPKNISEFEHDFDRLILVLAADEDIVAAIKDHFELIQKRVMGDLIVFVNKVDLLKTEVERAEIKNSINFTTADLFPGRKTHIIFGAAEQALASIHMNLSAIEYRPILEMVEVVFNTRVDYVKLEHE